MTRRAAANTARVHVLGASGSGTTTLGRSVADALSLPFLDSDDFYWETSDPPFQRKRPPGERVRLIEQSIEGPAGWVLAGSLCGWGDPLRNRFTLAVFVELDPAIRLERLRSRERARFGERLAPNGDMYQQHLEFMNWAASYDTATAPTRSRDLHERWLGKLECPVLRLDSEEPVELLTRQVLRALAPDATGSA